MSRRTLDKIMRGLEEAKAYLDGAADAGSYRVPVPEVVDVRAIREGLGLRKRLSPPPWSLPFAPRSLAAASRKTTGILLKVVRREPEAVTQVLVPSINYDC